MRVCEWCGKELEPNKGRFCDRSCSAKWRMTTYGPVKVSEDGRRRQAESMKNNWNKPGFREANHKRMTENNPVYQPGVVKKANATKLKNGSNVNNFKYGNGRMSVYEQIAWETLRELGFEYNKAIPTSKLRHKYPDKHIGFNYKPDFTNEEKRLCIEIDGHNHLSKHQQELDRKKEQCLAELGYTVIRFTHSDIDTGKLGEFIRQWQN